MKRIIALTFAIACLFGMKAQAQDIIAKRNGSSVRAKVIEVTETSVKYVLFDEMDGPVYTEGKDNISSITYRSGRTETFVRSASYADAYYGHDGRVVPEGIMPGMKYKEYAKFYDPRDYVKRVDDRYSPVWGGVGSLLIPGLGQMINGQVGRGFAFLGASVGSNIIYTIGAVNGEDGVGVILALVGAAGMLTADIWAIVDGVRVAKIKNLYTRDTIGMSSVDVKMEPYFAMTAPYQNNQVPVAGMKFSVSF